ncbi:MAG TPA: lipopolysaccharide kinase InaA family protein [Planctomycetota bacterium]|nr:lipopolysaccharide kinase InaA family protein [Planctomycetota bacterium]
MKLRCAPEDEALVRSVLEGRFPAESVKEGSLRTVRRIVPGEGGALYLKLFRDRGVGAAMRRLVADRAAREYAVLDHLRRARVAAATPVACGTHDGASFLITREIPGASTLKERLLDAGRVLRRRFMALLGGFVRAMHDAGVRHDDLHAGNILATGPGESADLYLIDVQRASIRPRMAAAERLKDLGFLLLSLRPIVSMTDRRKLLRAYWGENLSKAMLRDIGRAYLEARETYSEDRTRRCLIPGREFDKSGGMMLRRPLSASAAKSSFKAAPLREVKRIGRRRLWLATPDRFVREGPRAKRIWRNAHALAVRHVATPRLWAWSGDRILGEWLADAKPLNEYVDRPWTPREKRAFRDALAGFVREMHRAGVHHGDLKANNILVRPGPEFYVIDLDRAEFSAEVSLQDRLSDLAQLNAALGGPVTIGDRLAFYRTYAGRETEWNRLCKARVREIMKRTKARKHRWPTPKSGSRES